MRRQRCHRLIAAWLTWSLLTPSAWALRVSSEASVVGLEQALAPTDARVEDDGYPDPLARGYVETPEDAEHRSYLNRHRPQWQWIREQILPSLVQQARAAGTRRLQILVLGASTAEELARAFHELVMGMQDLLAPGESIATDPGDVSGWHFEIQGIERDEKMVALGNARLAGEDPFRFDWYAEGTAAGNSKSYAYEVIRTLRAYQQVFRADVHLHHAEASDPEVSKQFPQAAMVLANKIVHQIHNDDARRQFLTYLDTTWRNAWLIMDRRADIPAPEECHTFHWVSVQLKGYLYPQWYHFGAPRPAGLEERAPVMPAAHRPSLETLVHPRRMDYLKEIRHLANPDGALQRWLYPHSGTDASNFLLATDARVGVFLDQKPWANPGRDEAIGPEHLETYRWEMRRQGWVPESRFDELKPYLVQELSLLRAEHVRIRWIHAGVHKITFQWAYPGETSVPRTLWIFSGRSSWDHVPTFLRLVGAGVDGYFEKAKNLGGDILKDFTPYLRPGSVIVSDAAPDAALQNQLQAIPPSAMLGTRARAVRADLPSRVGYLFGYRDTTPGVFLWRWTPAAGLEQPSVAEHHPRFPGGPWVRATEVAAWLQRAVEAAKSPSLDLEARLTGSALYLKTDDGMIPLHRIGDLDVQVWTSGTADVPGTVPPPLLEALRTQAPPGITVERILREGSSAGYLVFHGPAPIGTRRWHFHRMQINPPDDLQTIRRSLAAGEPARRMADASSAAALTQIQFALWNLEGGVPSEEKAVKKFIEFLFRREGDSPQQTYWRDRFLALDAGAPTYDHEVSALFQEIRRTAGAMTGLEEPTAADVRRAAQAFTKRVAPQLNAIRDAREVLSRRGARAPADAKIVEALGTIRSNVAALIEARKAIPNPLVHDTLQHEWNHDAQYVVEAIRPHAIRVDHERLPDDLLAMTGALDHMMAVLKTLRHLRTVRQEEALRGGTILALPQTLAGSERTGLEEPPWPAGTGRARGVEEFPETLQHVLTEIGPGEETAKLYKRVQAIGNYLGWRQTRLLRAAGLSGHGSLKNYSHVPRPSTLHRMSEVLLTDPLFLLTGQSERDALRDGPPIRRIHLLRAAAGLTHDSLGGQLSHPRSRPALSSQLRRNFNRRLLLEVAETLQVPPVLLETGLRPTHTLYEPSGLAGFKSGLFRSPRFEERADVFHRALVGAWAAQGWPVQRWAAQIAPDQSHLYPGLAARLLAMRPATIEQVVHYGLLSPNAADRLRVTIQRFQSRHPVTDGDLMTLAGVLAPELARAHEELEEFFAQNSQWRPPAGYPNHQELRRRYTWDFIARGVNRARFLALLNAVDLEPGMSKKVLFGNTRSPEQRIAAKQRLVATLRAEPVFAACSLPMLRIYAWNYSNPRAALHKALAIQEVLEQLAARKWILPTVLDFGVTSSQALIKRVVVPGISHAQKMQIALGARDGALREALKTSPVAGALTGLAPPLPALTPRPAEETQLDDSQWAALDVLHRVAAWRQVTRPKFLALPIKPEVAQTFLEAVQAQLAAAHGTEQWPQTAEQLDPFLEQVASSLPAGLEEREDPLKILYVEDDPDVQQRFRDVIAEGGAQVTVVSTLAEAARVLEQERFDGYVFDWFIGDSRDVSELFDALDARPGETKPVLILSGDHETAAASVQQARLAQANRWPTLEIEFVNKRLLDDARAALAEFHERLHDLRHSSGLEQAA